jgi:solute carrier family 35 protein F5
MSAVLHPEAARPVGDATPSAAGGAGPDLHHQLRNELDASLEAQSQKRRSEYALGLFFLLLVVAIWNAATYLIQFIYSNFDFEGPFFLTWVCNSIFVGYLPLIYASSCLRSGERCRPRRGDVTRAPSEDGDDASPLTDAELGQSPRASGFVPSQPLALGFIPTDEATKVALEAAAVVSPFWFFANYAYNASLLHTSVASNTIISTTSGLFTCLISAAIGTEKLTRIKLAGVIFNLLGAGVIGLATWMAQRQAEASGVAGPGAGGDSGDGGRKETVWGDLVCLASAFMYAIYSILIKRMLPEDAESSTGLFFGFLGAFNFLVFGLGVVVVDAAGWEDYGSLNWQLVGCMLVNALFNNMLSDYLWARAMLLTSATVATVGLTLTIPAPLIIEAWKTGLNGGVLLYKCGGAALVVVGFVCVAVDWQPERKARGEGRDERPRRLTQN